LRDHKLSAVVGHTTKIQVDQVNHRLIVAGVVSGTGKHAQEVVANSHNDFPWKASIGASVLAMVHVRGGEHITVNGRTFEGPILVARSTILNEVSFVALGADDNTLAKVAAHAAPPKTLEVTSMEFEQWLQMKGHTLAELDEQQRAELKAQFDTRQTTDDADSHGSQQEGSAGGGDDSSQGNATADPAPAAPDGNTRPIQASAATTPVPNPLAAPVATDTVQDIRAQAAGELQRIADIGYVCGSDHPQIRARAVADGWDKTRTELEVLRVSRSAGPAIHTADSKPPTMRVLEASLRLGGREGEGVLVEEYDEPTIEAAYHYRGIGIRGLVDLCCMIEGHTRPEVAAGPNEIAAAGFSTVSLPGILSNTANKVMLAAYRSVPSAARRLATKLTASDFKTHTGYRLTGDMKLEEVGADGELKHARLGETPYPYAVKTYGKVFGLTRQMIKNDDLGAFTEIPRLIGRGSALTIEQTFWTLVLANTGSFFSAGNKNYISGAATVLDSNGLSKGVEQFLKQTDSEGDPILVEPRFLVAPPELKVDADELYTSTNITTGGGSSKEKQPTKNVHANKYEPVQVPYLSNSNYAGSSSAAWYLWGDPADVAAFGIAYLDGRETPVIEEAPLASDILGKAWRGYIDFGACQIDPRGAVKSKGAA